MKNETEMLLSNWKDIMSRMHFFSFSCVMLQISSTMKKSMLFLLFFVTTFFTNPLTAQIKRFTGNWTKIGTTYDFQFDLFIQHTGGNQVKAVFKWQVVYYDENDPLSVKHYGEKIGLEAKEYLRGTYDAKTQQYILKGYKKEDPHRLIGLDLYRLTVDKKGDIGGDSRAHHTWQGRINGKAARTDQV